MAKVKSIFFKLVYIEAHARGRQKRSQNIVRKRGNRIGHVGGAVRVLCVAWFLGITLGTRVGS